MYAASVLAALIVSALIVSATGGSWRAVASALIDGSVGAPGRWGETVSIASPLIVVALGTAVSSRGGLVNIGQEGQLLLGAACAAYLGVRLSAPGPLEALGLLAAGALGGALWAGIAAVLRFWRRVPEVLTTLLLITVAAQLTGYALKVEWLLLAPFRGDRSVRNQISEQIGADARLPRLSLWGNELTAGALLALLLAMLVLFVLGRTLWGFRLRMLGGNARTARRAGVSEVRYGATALLVSGGCAGLGGALMLAGGDFGNYRFTPGFSNNIGWEGLLVALVARWHPVGIIVVALAFAGLRAGSGFLAATGVEREIAQVVQALLVLALLMPPAVLFVWERRRAFAAADEGNLSGG